MSASCPKCQTPLDDADFGIKVCSKAECGAMLFVDFDGQVQLSGEDSVREPEAVPVIQVHSHLDSASAGKEETFPHSIPVENIEDEEQSPGSKDLNSFAAEEPAGDDGAAPSHPGWMVSDSSVEETIALGSTSSSEYPAEFGDEVIDAAIEHEAEATTEVVGEAANEEVGEAHQPPTDSAEWFDQPLEHGFTTPAQMNVTANVSEIVDFTDVVEFANSSELDNSPLVYHLWITGIDRRDVRSQVEDVLSDSRLNFHLPDVMKTLKDGVLELRDLNPVKASFIAARLRDEAVNFRWQQSIFGSESSSEESVEQADQVNSGGAA